MVLFEGIDNFRKLFTRQNYFNWRGRVDRRTFWTAWLVFLILSLLLDISFSDELPGFLGVLEVIMAIPMVCLEVRRLHDTGHSGKLVLWEAILCIAGLAFIVLSLGFVPVEVMSFRFNGFSGSDFAGVFVMIGIGSLLMLAALVLDIVIFVFLCMRTRVADAKEVYAIEDKSDAGSIDAADTGDMSDTADTDENDKKE